MRQKKNFRRANDVSVASPLADSYINKAADEEGAAAAARSVHKHKKYDDDAEEKGVIFHALPFETFGAWGEETVAWLRRLARLVDPESDPDTPSAPQSAFIQKWTQHISVALQCGNANICVARTNIDRLKAGKAVCFPSSTGADWGVGGYF